ncbi:MAG: hypothetical protein RIS70_2167 [Planctomycetota bacterium]
MSRLRLNELILVAAIMVVAMLTAALDSNHNYVQNPGDSVIEIIRQTSLLGIFALGAAVVIIAGGIDLSAGSMIAFSGTTCATFMTLLAPLAMKGEQPLALWVIVVSIAATILVGLLVGSLHAWLITVIRLPPFVATLATLVGLRSLGRVICEDVTQAKLGGKSTQIQIYDEKFRYLGTTVWIPALIFLVLAALVWFLLRQTVTGRHLYALGGNEQAAKLSGVQTDRVKWLAYCIGSVTATIAGILYIGDQAVADPQTLGRGYELNAIAAAVVGGVSLQGGVGTVPGTLLGALFLRVVIDGVAKVIKTGADVYEGLIVGIVVVVAVAFSQMRQALRTGREAFPGGLGSVTVVNLGVLTTVIVSQLAGTTWALALGMGVTVFLAGIKVWQSLRKA